MADFKARVAPIRGSYGNPTYISFEQGTVIVVQSSQDTEKEQNAVVKLQATLAQADEQREVIKIESSEKFNAALKEYTAAMKKTIAEAEYYNEYKEVRIALNTKLQNTITQNEKEEELAQAKIDAKIKPEKEAVRNAGIKNILLQTGITEAEAKTRQEQYSARIKEIELSNAAELEMTLMGINIISEIDISNIKENAELTSELEKLLENESAYSSDEHDGIDSEWEAEVNVLKTTHDTSIERIHAKYDMMEKEIDAIEEIYKELDAEVKQAQSSLSKWGVTTDAQNGTEWSDISTTEADIFFNTEDNPPTKWFQQLSAKYPEIELTLEYSIPENMTVENGTVLDSGTPFIDNEFYQSVPDLFRSLFENKKESKRISLSDGLAGSLFVSLILAYGIAFLLALPSL